MRNQGQLESGHGGNPFSILALLKACKSMKDIRKGSKLDEYIREHECLQTNTHIGSALVTMYAQCGALDKVQQVLKKLPIHDVVCWNALIAGYAQQRQGEEALKCFNDMLLEGHSPTTVTFICVLKACGSIGAAAKGKEVHDEIVRLGMVEKHIVLGNSLVDMYVKCGALGKAEQVLRELPLHDVVSWSMLIAGYAKWGQGEEALKCFDDMLHEGHSPDAVTFLYVLRACGSIGVAAKVGEIHETIASLGILQKDTGLGITLADMYVKCGAFIKAHQVHEELSIHDVVSWNILIGGYVQNGHGEEALKCFNDMLLKGHSPTVVTFVYVLKACGCIGAVAKGEEIHDMIVGLNMVVKYIVLGNCLVDMYVKCSALPKAEQVLKELLVRDVVSWNTLIAGYAKKGQGEEALKCLGDMLYEGHSPDAVTFICVLKACGSIRAAAKGEEVHKKIVNLGMLEKDIVLGNSLVDMYVKCGALAKAYQVHEELPFRDVVSWNALIAGYAKQGQGEEALKCFNDMLHEGHSPSAVTYLCILKAYGSIRAITEGVEIHDKIVSFGMLEKHAVLGISLMHMYVKCSAFAKAKQVLEVLPIRDVVCWSTLIAGYAQNGQGEEALKCLDDLLQEGHFPTAVTFICALKACGSIRASAKGEEIHGKIINLGMLEKDVVLGNSLVDMYVKCGALHKAHQVHKGLPIHDVVTWNALVAGYAEQGQGHEALKCFDDMLCEGHSPDAVTFLCVLKACRSIGAAAKGEETHNMIGSLGMLEKDIVLGTTLVDMYIKCGALAKAHQVFQELTVRDVVSWSALIAGYAQKGQGEEALKFFNDMLHEGHSPTTATFAFVLKACGSIGAAAKGEEVHAKIVSLGMLEKNIVLGNSLVNMYVKCGVLHQAQRVLEELPVCDAVSWSALISGYGQQGQSIDAIHCFEKMQSNGVQPNLVSLTALLNACSHSGLLDQAETYFSGMSTMYGFHPNLEHYYCLTDVFDRAGRIDKALSVIAKMPYDKCLLSYVDKLLQPQMCIFSKGEK